MVLNARVYALVFEAVVFSSCSFDNTRLKIISVNKLLLDSLMGEIYFFSVLQLSCCVLRCE
jgi:hypothetical protein